MVVAPGWLLILIELDREISWLFIYFIMDWSILTISFLGVLLSLTLSWSSFWRSLSFCFLAISLVLFLLLSLFLFLSRYYFNLFSLLSLLFWGISLLIFCDTWQYWWFSKMELYSRIESITFCLMSMSLFMRLFSDSRNLIFSLTNNTSPFSFLQLSLAVINKKFKNILHLARRSMWGNEIICFLSKYYFQIYTFL